MTNEIGMRELQVRFSEVFDEVRVTGCQYTITKHGKPFALLEKIDDERLRGETIDASYTQSIARSEIAEIVSRARWSGKRSVITRRGVSIAWIIPVRRQDGD